MTSQTSSRSALPYVIGVPVGLYAGAVAAFVAALLSTFRGVVFIPVFVVVSIVAVRFISRQIADFQTRLENDKAKQQRIASGTPSA
jgi:hypothetical protein